MEMATLMIYEQSRKIMSGKQNQFRSSIVIIKGVWNASGLQEK